MYRYGVVSMLLYFKISTKGLKRCLKSVTECYFFINYLILH
jgi:hypothetical protein